MSMRIAVLTSAAALSAVLLGSNPASVIAEDRATIIVTEEKAPVFVEEGVTLNGSVVAVPADNRDYVFINGAYYYYHPTLHTWVHLKHEKEWKPPSGGHIYLRWSEHPEYRK